MISDVHGRVAEPQPLLAGREAFYRMALDLITHDSFDRSAVDLANPFIRWHIGKMLSGDGDFSSETVKTAQQMKYSSEMVLPGIVGLLDDEDANTYFAEVLDLDSEEDEHDQFLCSDEDLALYQQALDLTVEGFEILRRAVPQLLQDVLPHVSLIAFFTPGGNVRSASWRQAPGLIAMQPPSSAIDAAEMLLHEAAHCRLFDMAIACDLIPRTVDAAPTFNPPWHPTTVEWPLEQVVAAAHAYACMAELMASPVTRGLEHRIPEKSGLWNARERAHILSLWALTAGGAYLGVQGRELIDGLLESVTALPHRPAFSTTLKYHLDRDVVVNLDAMPGQALIGYASPPLGLYFVPSTVAVFVRLVQELGSIEVSREDEPEISELVKLSILRVEAWPGSLGQK